MQFRRYKRRPDQAVSAVQLALETDGFQYRKWGGEQRCKAGDYLVDNDGDVYTVDRAVFERTYRKVSPGQYLKITPVWAWQSDAAGDVKTKEGVTHYAAHDYVASNDASGDDTYAVGQAKFEAMYELDPE
jgi:hypothetical protein